MEFLDSSRKPKPERETSEAYNWLDDARCRGLETTDFFPRDTIGLEMAQRVCRECTVRAECLDYALEHRIDHGVWGGASERERRRILRRRNNQPDLEVLDSTASAAEQVDDERNQSDD